MKDLLALITIQNLLSGGRHHGALGGGIPYSRQRRRSSRRSGKPGKPKKRYGAKHFGTFTPVKPFAYTRRQ